MSAGNVYDRLRPWPFAYQEGDWRQDLVCEALDLIRQKKLRLAVHQNGVGKFPRDEIFDFLVPSCRTTADRRRPYSLSLGVAEEMAAAVRMLWEQRPRYSEKAWYLPGVGLRYSVRGSKPKRIQVSAGLVTVHSLNQQTPVLASPLWRSSVDIIFGSIVTGPYLHYCLVRIGIRCEVDDLEWFFGEGIERHLTPRAVV